MPEIQKPVPFGQPQRTITLPDGLTGDEQNRCLAELEKFAAYSTQIDEARAVFENATIYWKIGTGLAFLRLQAVFDNRNEGNKGGGRGRKKNAVTFEDLLNENGASKSTAYRLMDAARGAGLTADDTHAKIEKWRKAGRFKDQTLGNLIAAAKQIGTGEDEPAPKGAGGGSGSGDPFATDLFEWAQKCRHLVNLRTALTPAQINAAADETRRTLEVLTGCRWRPDPDAPASDHGEHGAPRAA